MWEIISKEGVVYGGLDESNSGYAPTVYSLALSGYQKDVERIKGRKALLPKAKNRKQLERLIKRVPPRGHTFLLIHPRDYAVLGNSKRNSSKILGNIVASLSEDFLPLNFKRFDLFCDGRIETAQKRYARDFLAELYSKSKGQIKIYSGGEADRRYPLVNFADGLARYYFSEDLSLKALSMSPHKRELQYFI